MDPSHERERGGGFFRKDEVEVLAHVAVARGGEVAVSGGFWAMAWGAFEGEGDASGCGAMGPVQARGGDPATDLLEGEFIGFTDAPVRSDIGKGRDRGHCQGEEESCGSGTRTKPKR